MNQLIEKFIAESTICQGHPQIDGSYFDKEKFAELIVRECAEVSLQSSHRDDDMGAIIARHIKKHFGV